MELITQVKTTVKSTFTLPVIFQHNKNEASKAILLNKTENRFL
jgi:hypothetical protein